MILGGKQYSYCLLSYYYLWLLLLTLIRPQNAEAHNLNDKDSYIVFVNDEEIPFHKHIDILSSLKGSSDEANKLHVHSYKVISAFAAKLSKAEAAELSQMHGVTQVLRNRYHTLHTTRSWDFIGLLPTATRNMKVESDIIVGVLDTGITPQSLSFKDDGLGPPPSKWKGSCVGFANFSCNNKLIGARYFKLDNVTVPGEIMSPGDVSGHGTHTSSTAAGRPVDGANLSGLAGGTARGAVPSARVAMYKVCWANVGCSDQDILAGFDAAMADGVDIISISIAVVSETYETNTLAIGSFHAMRRGILTVASAGNDGPSYNTLYNHAPWLLTVGASGTDRQFRSDVVLGGGRGSTISGIGVNTYELQHNKSYPIATGVAVSNSSENDYNAMFCGNGSMAPAKVKGKIIYCKYGAELDADSVVKGLGGIGTVIESDNLPDTALVFMAPATIVNSTNGQFITHFINSTRSPSALIFKSKEVKVKAPFVASFSSRGPNPQVKRILKPDIVAPGIDILASYTPLQSITRRKGDTQYSQFNLFSGTSMSCPHVAGVAAYVKSFHPEWSPAAIKSAILTTATPMSSTVDREAEFAYGAGQVNPTRARNPGLVYDMENATMSYTKFLCREGSRNSSALSKIIGGSVDCSKLLRVSDANENGEDIINYPTMQLALGTGNKNPITVGVFKRTVTNVGMGRSYNATIFGAPKGVEISVKPMSLSFNSVGQKLNFTVVVKVSSISSSVPLVSASLIWRSNGYVVRSPIVIYNSSQYFF